MRITKFISAVILSTVTFAQAEEIGWRYNLPDAGLVPHSVNYEGLSRASATDGNSKFGIQEFGVALPLSDPTRSGYGHKCMLSAELDLGYAHVSSSGEMSLPESSLYSITLPVALLMTRDNGNRFMFAVAPSIDSDVGEAAGSMTIGMLASYTVERSNDFSYNIGLAYSPAFSESGFVPMVGFNWTINERWDLNLERASLELMYKVNESFQLGPIARFDSNAWIIHADEGRRRLRTRSFILAVQGEYKLAKRGNRQPIITAALGSSVYNRVDLLKCNSDQTSTMRNHYDPALYVSIGLDWAF